MLDAHAHVMQVKFCKANTRGVTFVASGGEVERFSSSAILGLLEASIILVVIGSLGGLADERMVDADSHA